MRLFVSTALFGAVIVLQPGLALTALDFGGLVIPLWVLAFPFTILCLVGLQNAINMADGMNGLLIGLSMFWTACLLNHAPPEHLRLYLTLMLLGLVILLLYNLAGALFLGDAGSYAIGGTIGVLMIYCYHSADGALPMLDRGAVAARAGGRLPARHGHARAATAVRRSRPTRTICIIGSPGTGAGRSAWRSTWPSWSFPARSAALWPDLSLAMIVLSLSCYGGLLLLTPGRAIARPLGSRPAEPTGGRPAAAPRDEAVDSPRGST